MSEMPEDPPEGDDRSGFVALAGKPNVGKSTLMNEMLGVKLSITTSKPQTTRNRILGVRTFPEKGQIGFVDTPGIHRARRQMNRSMVKTAVDSIRGVDVICHVVDVADFLHRYGTEVDPDDLSEEDTFVLEQYEEIDVPFVLALNKADKVSPKEKILPVIEFFHGLDVFEEIVPTSATERENVHRLNEVLLEELPTGPPMYPDDMLTDRAERFFAAEYIRAEVMRETREEVPYGVAVEIDKFAEKDDREMLEIVATIHVEQSGQKGIVIGEGGDRIKEIGTRARRQLEEFFGRDVYLETFVRVEEDWSEDESKLEQFL
jgi:GTP-binding protein Era